MRKTMLQKWVRYLDGLNYNHAVLRMDDASKAKILKNEEDARQARLKINELGGK